MIVGFRKLLLTGALGWGLLNHGVVVAQDPVQTELAALKKAILEQKDEIARLSTEVAKLNALLDNPRRVEAATAPAPGAPASTPAPAVEATRPTIVPPANVHVIVKGDSLDKIAKQHGITVLELQKLNKISDPKKLQIGQQLVLPPSADKAPAPDKAEKPQ